MLVERKQIQYQGKIPHILVSSNVRSLVISKKYPRPLNDLQGEVSKHVCPTLKVHRKKRFSFNVSF